MSAKPRKVTAASLEARVPRSAKTGPVGLLTGDGRTAVSVALLVIVGQGVSSGAIDARVASRKWYDGGQAIDPLPALKAWDRGS